MDQLKKEQFLTILEKLETGTASEAELDFLNAYYDAFKFREGITPALSNVEQEQLKNNLLAQIKTHRTLQPAKSNIISLKPYLRFGAAAALLTGICVGGWFFLKKPGQTKSYMAAAARIAPGTNGAILTLSSGQQIVLSKAAKGTLAVQAGITISKTANGQVVYAMSKDQAAATKGTNTLATARGEQYQIILPDGSHVWLNAASSISYPASFTGSGQREVTLAGEAYFEVAKDKAHPFIVHTDRQSIKVLGTHFNVAAYTEETETKTTLLEGAVQVTTTNGSNVKIVPGEQAIAGNQSLTTQNVDTDAAVAWKNGYFRFKDEKIESVMRQLARWYNIDIQYEGKVSDEGFNGVVSRYKNISQVLNDLEKTGAVHFKVAGRRITIIQ